MFPLEMLSKPGASPGASPRNVVALPTIVIQNTLIRSRQFCIGSSKPDSAYSAIVGILVEIYQAM